VNLSITNSLTEAELALLRETERDRLAGLDEDALAELHDRIRRARTKYVNVYRRTGAARSGSRVVGAWPRSATPATPRRPRCSRMRWPG